MEASINQRWWLNIGGQTDGPRSQAYVQAAVQSGQLAGDALACPEGGREWRPLSAWPEFASHAPRHVSSPPPPPASIIANAGNHSGSLLTNPALPSMANWICIYALVISPILFFLYHFSCLMTAGWVVNREDLQAASSLINVLDLLRSLASTIVMFLGAMKLRQLRGSGLYYLRVGLWIGLAGGLAMALCCYLPLGMMDSMSGYEEIDNPSGALVGLMLIPLWLGEILFMIVTLVWLYKYQGELPLDPHR